MGHKFVALVIVLAGVLLIALAITSPSAALVQPDFSATPAVSLSAPHLSIRPQWLVSPPF